MKIGIYDMYLEALGGGEKYILSIAAFLSQQHEVDIFWDDKEVLQKAKKRFNLPLEKVKIKKNIFMGPISFIQKRKIMKSYDMIIVLSDGSIPFLFAKRNLLHFQFPIPWVKKLTFLDKLKLSRIEKIICNSVYTQKSVRQIFTTPSTVLYPPCEMISKGNKKENIILSVGRYNRLGNGDDFKKLEMMKEIFQANAQSRFKGWKLVLIITAFADDMELIMKWKEQAKKDGVDIIINASHAAIVESYQKAKIYWHAAGFGENLKIHPERAEHFGISIVEAMSAGVVPVVIKEGGIPEIVREGENGLLWETKEELIKKTEKLIKNEDYRQELSAKAIKEAVKYSEDVFKQKLYDIIK